MLAGIGVGPILLGFLLFSRIAIFRAKNARSTPSHGERSIMQLDDRDKSVSFIATRHTGYDRQPAFFDESMYALG